MDLAKIPLAIPKEVQAWAEKHATSYNFMFVSLLSYRYGEIVERTFGTRRYAKSGVKITEVRRRATGEHEAIVKNLLYGGMAGYVPVFEKEDRYSHNGWHSLVFSKEDFDQWYEPSAPCNFWCVCLNPELVRKTEEFKYCGYSQGDVIEFLNAYRENPMVEVFGKMRLPLSSILMKKAEKDKRFRTFLCKNVDDARRYGSRATAYAYDHGMGIEEASIKLLKTRKACSDIPQLRKTGIDAIRVWDWCKTNGIGCRVYNDYLEAIKGLQMDLTDTKNTFPKDFATMHDLRISEYESLKAKQDRIKRKELYESFAKAGEKATAYEYSHNGYSLVAPRDISDLKKEGGILGHCVGKMGYDKKMADGKVVIMFLRQDENPGTPFVTIEYDLTKAKLLQAYGKSNSKPTFEAMVVIDEWVNIMQKLLKERKQVCARKRNRKSRT